VPTRPTDGKHFLNPQRMNASMGKAPKAPGMDKEPEEASSAGGGAHSELHDHGNGSFHTVMADGTKTEHPHLHHALAHMAAHHGPGEKHHLAHHDGMSMTTHHVGEDGQVQGPHDHDNAEAMKDNLGKFFNEEESEGGGWGGGEKEPAMAEHDMSGM
jgi:hypothetical protein